MCSNRTVTWQEISFSFVTSTDSKIPGGGLLSAIPSSIRLIREGNTGRHIPAEGKARHPLKVVEMGSAMHWILSGFTGNIYVRSVKRDGKAWTGPAREGGLMKSFILPMVGH